VRGVRGRTRGILPPGAALWGQQTRWHPSWHPSWHPGWHYSRPCASARALPQGGCERGVQVSSTSGPRQAQVRPRSAAGHAGALGPHCSGCVHSGGGVGGEWVGAGRCAQGKVVCPREGCPWRGVWESAPVQAELWGAAACRGYGLANSIAGLSQLAFSHDSLLCLHPSVRCPVHPVTPPFSWHMLCLREPL